MVRKNQRKPSDFDVLNVALDMTTYTIDILSNPKTFDPKHSKIIDRMIEEATAIYHYARVANGIRVYDKFAADERLRLQEEAEIMCERLTSDIMISHRLFHLRLQRINVWSEKVENTEKLLHKWHLSDKERYSK